MLLREGNRPITFTYGTRVSKGEKRERVSNLSI